MATKYQTELALKVLLTELHRSDLDVHKLIDTAIAVMHTEKMFVKEDSSRERGGAKEALFTSATAIAGPRSNAGQKPDDIEYF